MENLTPGLKRSTELANDVNLIFKLAYYPSKYLRQHTELVTDFTDIPQIVEAMFKTMLLHDGIGLAANQCKLVQRIFVMRTENMRRAFVNPTIGIAEDSKVIEHDERCLSFPGVVVKVPRQTKIMVEAQDIYGEQTFTFLEGLEAICAQHEIEHLDGKTFIDSFGRMRKMKAERLVNKAVKDPKWQTKRV